MATFISLVDFTQQGIRDFKDSPDRAAKFKSMAEKVGVKVMEVYWTMGVHDAVLILEAPDDESGNCGNARLRGSWQCKDTNSTGL